METRKTDPSIHKRETRLQELNEAYQAYVWITQEAETGLKVSILPLNKQKERFSNAMQLGVVTKFYQDLIDIIAGLRVDVEAWVQERRDSMK